jgi:V8-like Glu-specific endopeptidase
VSARWLLLGAVAVLWSHASPLQAQVPFRAGFTQSPDIALTPGAPLRVQYQGAEAIRLRLVDADRGAGRNYTIIVRDRNERELFRVEAQDFARDGYVWTPLLYVDGVDVLLSNPGGAAVAVKVAELAVMKDGVRAFSIVGTDQRQQVYELKNEPRIFQSTRPVAKLTFQKGGFPDFCTGFMIDGDRMLTNYHCVADRATCTSTYAIFGYEYFAPGQLNPNSPQYKCLEVLKADKHLDMALLRVAGSPGQQWGHLQLSRRKALPSEQALVIQHGGGKPKQIAFRDCTIKTVPAPNWLGPESTDVGHVCDTERGSSGSPLLGSDYKVVGLHHMGFTSDGSQWALENRAVEMGLIMNLLSLP